MEDKDVEEEMKAGKANREREREGERKGKEDTCLQ